jgi:NitT/TauT family transport system ATP-binding protein
VQETVNVDLPAPRDQVETKELPEFGHLGAHVYRAIKHPDEAAVGARSSGGTARAAPAAPDTLGP